ncbi:MAG: porphobilinogen synthase [bacterium]|nr:porphobilinogen synthase [bacterium]
MYSPVYRLRRLRQNENFRRMIREAKLSVDDLIMPYFVVHGKGIRQEIPSMPGNFRLSIDELIKEVEDVKGLNIPAVLLFGIPETKDETGTYAYAEDGIIQQAVRAIKERVRDIIIITDVCLCEYTTHGHCGVIESGEVVNDSTLEILSLIALSHVKAGSDMVAPSDMMDGRVGAIRRALDENGYKNVPIMSYAAKYASAFYSPFREAAESTPAFGDRRSYQMDIANADEALREARLDIDEGADIIMIKPALSYLDVIYRVKNQFGYPVAAYNVSGEFAMIKSAASSGLIDEKKTVLEILTSIKRAGADVIITYFAKDVAEWIS